jgi:hypothetical protein
MQLLRGTQYQGYPETLTVKGINYFSSPTAQKFNRSTFYFDNPSEWNALTGLTGITGVPPVNTGTEVFSGVSDSVVTVAGINGYNPLSQTTRDSTKPAFVVTNQYFGKLVSADYSQKTAWKFTAKGQTANDTFQFRLYPNATNTDYYNVVMAMPLPNVEYTFNFNPFVAGTYGAVSPAVTIGSRQVASGQSLVTLVGSPVGQLINRIVLVGVGANATSKMTPIALEGANSYFSLFGNKFQIPVCCLAELTDELDRTYLDLKCGKKKSGKRLDEQTETITFKVQKNNTLLRALGYTSEIYETTLDIIEGPIKLNLTSVSGNVIASPSGNIVINAVTNLSNIDYISIDKGGDCVALQRDYVKNTTATLDPNAYYVDFTNNRIVFSNDVFNYGQVEVYVNTPKLATVFDHYTEQNPVKVILEWQTKNVAGTRTRYRKVVAELGYPKDSVEDEGNTTEFECNVILTGYDQSIEAEF